MSAVATYRREYPVLKQAIATVGIYFLSGTGGCIRPEPMNATGALPFMVHYESATPTDFGAADALLQNEKQKPLVLNLRIESMIADFGFTKSQLAEFLSITRVTLDKWLNGGTLTLRRRNSERLSELESVLNAVKSLEGVDQLGSVLRNSHDPDVVVASATLKESPFSRTKAEKALKDLRYRLVGKQASQALDELLSNSPALG